MIALLCLFFAIVPKGSIFDHFSSLNDSKQSVKTLARMASSSSRHNKGKGVALPSETPSFFKVVLDEALRDGRLEIEGYIAAKFKSCLADKILLKVPNAEVWPIALSWDVGIGSLWLEKGWQEFANFYSLEHGCFLFFTYEGVGSCFKVRIFKENSLETDYPFKSQHHDGVLGEAFWRASQFESDHPFFAVHLSPSYLNRPLRLNHPFVDRYISREPFGRSVNLQIPEGGTWSAEITVSRSGSQIFKNPWWLDTFC